MRTFVRHLQQWSGKPWDQLVYEAQVPTSTAAGWLYGRATPETPGLLRLMRAAGLLTDDYMINAPSPADVAAAKEQAADLRAAAEEQSRLQPGEQESSRAAGGDQ